MSPDSRRLHAALAAVRRTDPPPNLLRAVPLHEVTAGMVVRVDPARRLTGTVVEVREPSHGLAAAHGGLVVVVEYERLLETERARFGTHYRITHTLFTFNDPQVWAVPWEDATTDVTQRYADTTTEEKP